MEAWSDRASGDRQVVAAAARAFAALIAEARGAGSRLDDGNGVPISDGQIPALGVLSAVGRADRLANQLLAYAGGQALSPAKLELFPFLRDLGDTLRRVLDVRIDVSMDVVQDCPSCHVDRHALEEALLNLIINARDAMPDGGRLRLSARAAQAPDGSPTVELSVSDSGPGVAADFALRAAQPFVTTKASSPQAGMGLAATDGFARQSGGRLTLSCPVGLGVTATVSLPQATTDHLPTASPFDDPSCLFALARDIVESATDAILTADEGQIIVMANPAAALIFRCPIAKLVGAPLERFIPQRYHASHRRDVQDFGEGNNAKRSMGRTRDVMGLRIDGEEFPIDAAISHLNTGGRQLYTVILRDMSLRRIAEAALRESEARLRRLLMLLPVAVIISSGNRISFVNESARRLLGADEAALIGRSSLELVHPDSIELVQSRIAALRGGAPVVPSRKQKIVRTDGTIRVVEATSILIDDRGEVSILEVMRDETDLNQLRADLAVSRRIEEKFHALAHIDSLTGLHNRRRIDEHVEESMARTRRNACPMALMFVDVDRFKQINDTYGHAIGDGVLQEIAIRIHRCARVTDTVGRYGGDEFLIVIEGLRSADDAKLVARKILTEMASPFVFGEVTLPSVTASIGVAFYTGEDIALASVVARADEALYQAKGAGRDTFVLSHWLTEDGERLDSD